MDVDDLTNLNDLDLRNNYLKFIDCTHYKVFTNSVNIHMGGNINLTKHNNATKKFCKTSNILTQHIAILTDCPKKCICFEKSDVWIIKCKNLVHFPFIIDNKLVSKIKLDLDENKLKIFEPFGEEAALDKIIEVTAKNNEISEFCFEFFTNNVRKIDVSYNMIENIDEESAKILNRRNRDLKLVLTGNVFANDSKKVIALKMYEFIMEGVISGGVAVKLSLSVIFIGITYFVS